ncbi:hypothetical protein LFT48_16105 [Arthrobacter sp. FW305-123]|nr:hypothetical protein LFT48_16105 [Arthrobacter sp. FW305-123]
MGKDTLDFPWLAQDGEERECPAQHAFGNYTGHAREQVQMLSNRNSLSAMYLNEMGHIKSNFENALDTGFPKDFPLLLFVVAENKQVPEWLELHHRQGASVTIGIVVPLPGRALPPPHARGWG